MKYDAKYFINKFEKIPDNEWNVGHYNDNNTSCALGHCGVSDDFDETKEGKALEKLFRKTEFLNVIIINDCTSTIAGQLGDKPKERIINALVLIDSGILNES